MSGLLTVSFLITTFHQTTFYLLSLLALYCFTTSINEALGVTLSETRVSFPRRILPEIPFLSFGRRSIDFPNIYQLQILKNSGMTRNYREQKLKNSGIRRCILINNQFEFCEVIFPQKSQRDLFTLTLDVYNPGLNVTRRVAPPKLLTSWPGIHGLNLLLACFAMSLFVPTYIAEISKLVSATQKTPPHIVKSDSNVQEGEKFLLYAASYDWGTNRRNKVKKKLEELQKCSGIDLQITTNLDYKFLTPPTKRWSITAGPYPRHEAYILRDKLITCGVSDPEIKEAEIDE